MILPAIADGRLNVSGVGLIAAKLAEIPKPQGLELLRATLGKTRTEIQLLLAERFPEPDVPTSIRALPEAKSPINSLPAPGPGKNLPVSHSGPADHEQQRELATENLALSSPPCAQPTTRVPAATSTAHPRIAPLSPQRFALHLTMHQEMHDRLRRLQQLMSHSIPSGDVVQVLDRAMIIATACIEKRKLARADRPRKPKARANASRTIPAHVTRAVQERDQGQCTFMSESGHRCSERRFLEFDHIAPYAIGGEATVANIRLRCRSHNQYEADQIYGAGFMHMKREAARRRAS